MQISIRKFCKQDIENKIKWINNPKNNQFLHYDIPIEYNKTVQWFERNYQRPDRYDAVIEVDHNPVGLIGLLDIDNNHSKAEYYVAMGETDYKGRGIARRASELILEYAFRSLRLQKVYLYTERDNILAQKLFARAGFKIEGLLQSDIKSRGFFIDRYVMGITRNIWLKNQCKSPISNLGSFMDNHLYIKREDMIPYSFGGNKARKAELFFNELDKGNYDHIVTYGTSHSNHCRVIANMAVKRNLPCTIVSPLEVADETYNSRIIKFFDAKLIFAPVKNVKATIEKELKSLRDRGYSPYFIEGGGHGNLGTEAYVQCYEEIRCFEEQENIHFDFIFFASGTGTTQAGLVCGQILNKDEREIIGISIARRNPRGRDIVIDSIRAYLEDKVEEKAIQEATIFVDKYVGEGYAANEPNILKTIGTVFKEYGIPLDETYTGKAFMGMSDYIKQNRIAKKNILFIHTGGTPLFFDNLNKLC